MILEDVVMMVALPALAAWILWLLYKRHELAQRIKLERLAALSRLVEKAGTTQELADLLRSDAGSRLLGEPAPEAPPRAHLLRFVLGGVILALAGAAFLIGAAMTAATLGPQPDINYVREILEKKEWAIFFLCLAMGFWLVALIYHLAARRRP